MLFRSMYVCMYVGLLMLVCNLEYCICLSRPVSCKDVAMLLLDSKVSILHPEDHPLCHISQHALFQVPESEVR